MGQVQSDLFLRYGEALYSPKCHVVYVVAPFLLYERDTSVIKYAISAHYRLPDFQLVKRNGQLDTIGRARLREIIRKRVGDGLFSKGALDEIVVHSGGLVRALIRLAREALLVAECEGASRATWSSAEAAVRRDRRAIARTLRRMTSRCLRTCLRQAFL